MVRPRPRCVSLALLLALLLQATLACLVPGALHAASTDRLSYPPAERGSVEETHFGTVVADPYRWMEDIDAPSTRAWLDAERGLTRHVFDTLDTRTALRHRIAELVRFDQVHRPHLAGNRYFYTLTSGATEQPVLYATPRLAENGRVLFDPNTLSPDGHLFVNDYRFSADGHTIAYGVSEGGSDWTEWRLLDASTGKPLRDVLRNTKYYAPQFAHDGAGLYYSAFPAPAPGKALAAEDLHDAVYFHAIGAPADTDRLVYADPDHPDRQFEPHLSEDGRWLVILSGEGEVGDKGLEDVALVDLASPGHAPVPMATGFQAGFVYVGADAGSLYFLTSWKAPNGRVIRIDPAHPDPGHWQVVVPEGADAIDFTAPSVTLVAHQLLVRSLHDAQARVTAYGLDGALRGVIDLPAAGSAYGFSGRATDRETFYSFQNPVTAPTVYRLDLATLKSSVFRAPKVAFDARPFDVHLVFYPGKDGTRIPMHLAYRKGLALDGTHPVLLYGYGGFGIPLDLDFDAARIAWLERGGILALPHLRGGGEYGEAWHQQGTRLHKQVVFDDFMAASDWLIAQRYTSPSKLAIWGASNGGLLIGACLTQRPDLFGAAIVDVGVLDMLRFDRFGQGAGWTGDYGSPAVAEEFQALYAYSPLHNVHAGTPYPATLVVTGDHDTRVFPAHSFKFTAALQAAQAGPAPILLYLEDSSGHDGGATTSQEIDQNMDIYAFLLHALGADRAAAPTAPAR